MDEDQDSTNPNFESIVEVESADDPGMGFGSQTLLMAVMRSRMKEYLTYLHYEPFKKI